jgi:hypothetical protein
MSTNKQILWSIVIAASIALIYQFFIRYQYVAVTSSNPFAPSQLSTTITRIDRLTGQLCRMPCSDTKMRPKPSPTQLEPSSSPSAMPSTPSNSWADDPDEDRTLVHLSRFETLTLPAAVSGVVGPSTRWVLAIPLDSGGSGGAFEARVYGFTKGIIQPIQLIKTDSGIVRLAIIADRLVIITEHHLPSDENCCPSGLDETTYAMNGDHLSAVTSKTIANPSPSPASR